MILKVATPTCGGTLGIGLFKPIRAVEAGTVRRSENVGTRRASTPTRPYTRYIETIVARAGEGRRRG